MKFTAQKATALLASLLLLTFGSIALEAPAQAANYSTQPGDAVGLIVKYQSSTNFARAISATLARANAIDSQSAIVYQHSIGLGYHIFKFGNKISTARAEVIRQAVSGQPGVLKTQVDKIVSLQSASAQNRAQSRTAAGKFATGSTKQLAKPVLQLVRGASAVRLPKAVNGCVTLCSTTGFVTLTWAKPLTFGSYPLSNYRIQASNDGENFATIVANAGKATSYNVTALTPGKRYWFRVAAVTKSKNRIKVGPYSAAVTAVPTTKPAAPILASEPVMYSTDLDPVWFAQNRAQRGGGNLVHYTITATAAGHTTQTCDAYTVDTITYSCAIRDKLDAAVAYSIQLSASNKHGVTQAAPKVKRNDDYYANSNRAWHLKSRFGVNAPGAWGATSGAKTVTVAVLDSGLTYIPELDGQFYKNANGTFYGYDFVSGGSQPNDGDGWDANPLDQKAGAGGEWHGTEVASLIAAKANEVDSVGVAPNVKILPVRVLGATSAPVSDLVAGILWAAGFPTSDSNVPQNIHPADVMNLSIQTASTTECDPVTQDALYAASEAGTTIVIAAGNNGETGMLATESYPGNCDSTVTVGATSYSNARAYYSNRGPGVSISAPGGDWSIGDPGETDALWFSTNSGSSTPVNDIVKKESTMVGGEGTSYAAPIVSGVVALMYSVNPEISFYDVYQIITSTAKPFVPLANPNLVMRNDCSDLLGEDTCGSGIIDAGRAVAAAARLP